MPEAEIKRLMKSLGESINETLSESPKINEAIQSIRDTGYEVFLIIEATIGFNKREGDESEGEDTLIEEPHELTTNGRARFTTQDQRFLKALRIAVDEEV